MHCGQVKRDRVVEDKEGDVNTHALEKELSSLQDQALGLALFLG